MRTLALTAAFGLALFAPATGVAAASPAQLCDAVADRAGDAHGVPRSVMRAITRTETGRTGPSGLEPWPWTVNMEGAGRWFESPEAALAYVEKEQARGATSFDVGCFQINHRWHGQHFASVEAMFQPMANADYAAQFLKSLYAETGSWSKAAGFYHSRTPEFVERYRARFDRILAGVDETPVPDTVIAETPGAVERPQPLLWRAVEAQIEPPPGGVAVRIARGGLGALIRSPTRPLFE